MTTAAERKSDSAGWTHIAELEAELDEWKQFSATAEAEIAHLRAGRDAVEELLDRAELAVGEIHPAFLGQAVNVSSRDVRAALRGGSS